MTKPMLVTACHILKTICILNADKIKSVLMEFTSSQNVVYRFEIVLRVPIWRKVTRASATAITHRVI